jgi:uncharacterized protein (TIGR00297 family)
MPPDTLFLSLATGLGVSLVLAGVAYIGRALSLSGVVAAVAVGGAVWAGLGWRGFALLAAFFLLASGLTRLGYRSKAAAGLAEARGGRRSGRQVLANGGIGAVAALLAAGSPGGPLGPALGSTSEPLAGPIPALPLALAFAAALATAAADTSSTEVGQLLRRRTWLVTTLRPVPPGTDGGVSLPGTGAALGTACRLDGLGAGLGLYPAPGALAVGAAAFLGAMVDSLLGATLERRGLVANDRVNLLATLTGALAAPALARFLL